MASKRSIPKIKEDNGSSVQDMDSDDDSDVDPVNFEAEYKIKSLHTSTLRSLTDFLNNASFIRDKGDPSTNIVDRLYSKCYSIPDHLINRFFTLLEACRREKIKMMFSERQLEYSGIMIDFDIYQDTEESQITPDLLQLLVQKIATLLLSIFKFNSERVETYACVTKKPKVLYKEDDHCYKDGFHLLFPGIKITKGAKKFLIKKIIENEIIDRVFKHVEPSKKYKKNNSDGAQQYKKDDFLDQHCAVVPVFFIGSSTKNGAYPYKLTNIYHVILSTDNKDVIVSSAEEISKMIRKGNPDFNCSLEFSLNFKGKYINKEEYEPINKLAGEIKELETSQQTKRDEELIINQTSLSTNAVKDIAIKEIKELLDMLNPRRYNDYEPWYKILCILASASPTYKDLAEYFSRKSPKFNAADFEKYWLQASRGTYKNPLTIGTLHQWAKEDNPNRYDLFKKNTVTNLVINKIHESFREGKLNHFDIAEILYKLLHNKYICDIPEGENCARWFEFILDDDDHLEGELYKWHMCKKEDKVPISLSIYISTILPRLFDQVIKLLRANYDKSSGNLSKYYANILKNFKNTTQRLGEHAFKMSVMKEAEIKFARRGFAAQLDRDPLIIGVANGILKLDNSENGRPRLITGYHNYKVSRYTNVPYIPFNPHDPITKKILITLRNMFPDNEPDSHEFIMNFLATTLDGNPKESMFLLMVGPGANGKSFLLELHKSAIGDIYGAKMQMDTLTSFANTRGQASPDLMMLKYARLATYSESNSNEVLNLARIKEFTGMETIAARGLFKEMDKFRPSCHHIATTNHDFILQSTDYGVRRRIIYMALKIIFMVANNPLYNPADPNIRLADNSINTTWVTNPEIQGRYLGILVWYNYFFYRKYNGSLFNIKRPHLIFDTEKYFRRQDTISQFLSIRLVKLKDDNESVELVRECYKYNKWYILKFPGSHPPKNITDLFKNSQIGRNIKSKRDGDYLYGYRFLDEKEEPNEEKGEKYAIETAYDMAADDNNFGIAPESTEQYYERICSEFDKFKDIFSNKEMFNNLDIELINSISRSERANKEYEFKDIECKIKLQPLENPQFKNNENSGDDDNGNGNNYNNTYNVDKLTDEESKKLKLESRKNNISDTIDMLEMIKGNLKEYEKSSTPKKTNKLKAAKLNKNKVEKKDSDNDNEDANNGNDDNNGNNDDVNSDNDNSDSSSETTKSTGSNIYKVSPEDLEDE